MSTLTASLDVSNIMLPRFVLPPMPNLASDYQQVQAPVEVVLMSHQVVPYANVENAIRNMTAVLMVGPTGSGKTIIGIKLAKKFNMILFVLAPASLEDNWTNEAKKYGMELVFISYTRLAGKSGKISHPYLRCTNGDFYVTDELKNLVSRRVLVIFDESQNIKKTTSLCSQACYTFSRYIRQVNNGSRLLITSAMPFDKVEFAESVFKQMAIIQQKQLLEYRVAENEYILEGYGFEEAVAYCNKINPDKMAQLYPDHISATSVRTALFDMLVDIVKVRAIFTMPRPPIMAKFLPEAHYYNVPVDERSEIERAIAALQVAARPNGDNGAIAITGSNMGRITKALLRVERSKIKLIERQAKKILEGTINDKVIIYLWYNENVDTLLNALAKWNPLRCDGEVIPKKRAAYIKLFQRPDNQYRLIIAKPTAMGVGISLDDRDGRYQRHILINPNFHFDKIHQASGRAYRVTTKSDSRCTLCYVKNTQEYNIITALSKKPEVTKAIVFFEDENDEETEEVNVTIFPEDYPKVEDSDDI